MKARTRNLSIPENTSARVERDVVSFVLKPRPPFRLDLAVWTLRRRPENSIDCWEDGLFRRIIPMSGRPAMIEVRQLSPSDAPRLSVQVHCDRVSPVVRTVATAAVEQLLGIRLDLRAFYDFAAGKPKLGPLARRFRGMKPPRYLTGFECLANAIACQQISLAAGIQLLNRLALAFGMPMESGGYRQYAFPRPQDLAHATQDELVRLGFSRQKALALLELARSCHHSGFDLHALQSLSDDACGAKLCQLRGIGRWSAEYAMLRGLGRWHVFPGDDVGARNSLMRWLGLSEELDYDNFKRVLNRWSPFGGLIYFHLLLDKLAAAGHLLPRSASRTLRQ